MPAIVDGARQALSVVPPVKWILRVCDEFCNRVRATVGAYQYRRQTRSDFSKILEGWSSADAECRAAHGFCQRAIHQMDHRRQEQFMMAVVAYVRQDAGQAVADFAQAERIYVQNYFGSLQIRLN